MAPNRVPVPAGSEAKSYYKYLNRELAPIPAEKVERLHNPVGNPAYGMSIHGRNKLLDPGYLPGAPGLYQLERGGAVIANLTQKKGCTGEMLEW